MLELSEDRASNSAIMLSITVLHIRYGIRKFCTMTNGFSYKTVISGLAVYAHVVVQALAQPYTSAKSLGIVIHGFGGST